jgi:hypothetical protein
MYWRAWRAEQAGLLALVLLWRAQDWCAAAGCWVRGWCWCWCRAWRAAGCAGALVSCWARRCAVFGVARLACCAASAALMGQAQRCRACVCAGWNACLVSWAIWDVSCACGPVWAGRCEGAAGGGEVAVRDGPCCGAAAELLLVFWQRLERCAPPQLQAVQAVAGASRQEGMAAAVAMLCCQAWC